MPIGDELLNPIPGASPCGANLRYDPVYEKIKEARREEEDIPQGEWAHTVKKADWPVVVKLCTDALDKKSKDLQIAAWLTEALVRREGFAGLRQGIDLCRQFLELFWDGLYPEEEDGDLELRASPLEWIGSRLDDPLKKVPLTKSGLDWFKFRESRSIGYEEEVAGSDQKTEARTQAIADGKITPEDFDKAVLATSKDFYKEKLADIEGCLEAIDALAQICEARFGDFNPSFSGLKDSLEIVRQPLRVLLAKKLEVEPDEDATAAEEAPQDAAEDSSGWDQPASGSAAGAAPARAPKKAVTAEPASKDDAYERIAAIGRWLRAQDTYSPVPYVISRALRWVELRAGGTWIDTNLLEAPPSDLRQRMKKLAGESGWEELIGVCEDAMALPCSRGWLDLQRYFVKACEGYGGYDGVKAAVLSELKALLADYPDLPKQMMLDDTPAANPETQAWLIELIPPPAPAEAEPEEAPAPAPQPGAAVAQDDAFDQAKQLARKGKADQAIELLTREVAKERSGRARFQRNLQLAQICTSAGHESIAYPILQGLSDEIERRNLEDWEASDMLANVLGLLFRCMAKLKVDSEQKDRLYQRICRLDPLQAMHLAK